MEKSTASTLDAICGALLHALNCYNFLAGEISEATDTNPIEQTGEEQALTYYEAYRVTHGAGELLLTVNESFEKHLNELEQVIEELYKQKK